MPIARSTLLKNEKMADSLRKFEKKCNFRSLSVILLRIDIEIDNFIYICQIRLFSVTEVPSPIAMQLTEQSLERYMSLVVLLLRRITMRMWSMKMTS